MKTTHGHSDANGRRISGDNLSEFCGEIARQNEAVSTVDWTRTARSLTGAAGLEWTPLDTGRCVGCRDSSGVLIHSSVANNKRRNSSLYVTPIIFRPASFFLTAAK